ncbi:MAG TPA: hypothetical protein VFP69_08480 [Streptomyces sp.]|nr:hypothetical protein [Streptomyces sp.]
MGELPSGDGHTGPRRAHPGRPGPEPGPGTGAGTGLETLLAAALRVDHVDAEAEQRAVRAFRAARLAGTHREARTRRRDDWRPRGLRGGRSLRTTLAVLLAGFTLGGVAFAAIGGPDSASRGAGDGPRPAGTPSDAGPGTRRPGAADAPPPAASAGPGRPEAVGGTVVRCRAYVRAKQHGEGLLDVLRQRLADVAGGEKKVDGYCARTLLKAREGAEGGREGAGEDTTGAPAVPDLPAVPTAPDVPVPVPTGAPADPTGAPPLPPTVPGEDGDGEGSGDGVTGNLPDPDQGQDQDGDQARGGVTEDVVPPDTAVPGPGTGGTEDE